MFAAVQTGARESSYSQTFCNSDKPEIRVHTLLSEIEGKFTLFGWKIVFHPFFVY